MLPVTSREVESFAVSFKLSVTNTFTVQLPTPISEAGIFATQDSEGPSQVPSVAVSVPEAPPTAQVPPVSFTCSPVFQPERTRVSLIVRTVELTSQCAVRGACLARPTPRTTSIP